MISSEQASSIAEFGRLIYPIWKGIEEKDIEADASKTLSEVNAPGQVLFDCLTLHRQDLAIYRSGIKPNRVTATPVKTAAGNKYSGWRGE